MKKLRCKIQYGTWFYKKINADIYNGLDAPIYELYDKSQKLIADFGCYDEMKSAVEYGNIEEYIRLHG